MNMNRKHDICESTNSFVFFVSRNNCERDALIVGCVNSATSIYAAIPIFAILGFKANENFDNCRNEYVSLKFWKSDINPRGSH